MGWWGSYCTDYWRRWMNSALGSPSRCSVQWGSGRRGCTRSHRWSGSRCFGQRRRSRCYRWLLKDRGSCPSHRFGRASACHWSQWSCFRRLLSRSRGWSRTRLHSADDSCLGRTGYGWFRRPLNCWSRPRCLVDDRRCRSRRFRGPLSSWGLSWGCRCFIDEDCGVCYPRRLRLRLRGRCCSPSWLGS